MSIAYHVFRDNEDHYFDTLKEARALIKKWKKEETDSWRLYKLIHPEKEDTEEEEYLDGEGFFPI